MADDVARIARDRPLHDEASRLANGLGGQRFTQAPWHTIARARDGRPVAAAAAAGDHLLIASAAKEGDLLVPTLVRAIAENLASPPNLSDAEILAIPDSQLRAWSRPSGPPLPRPETVERDDRRWLWGMVLVLLAVEAWMRRSKAAPQPMAEETQARVA